MRVKSDSFKKGTTTRDKKKLYEDITHEAVINARTKQRSASETLRSARELYKYLVFVHPLINARSKSLSLMLSLSVCVQNLIESEFFLGIWVGGKKVPSIFLADENWLINRKKLIKRRRQKEEEEEETKRNICTLSKQKRRSF